MARLNPERSLPFDTGTPVEIVETNRSTHYAAQWLRMLGCQNRNGAGTGGILIVGGEAGAPDPESRSVIRLWDFQVGLAGTGVHASAVSGASAVIGHRDGPGLPLAADMPEKWCGAYGVILVLAELWRRLDGNIPPVAVYDISAADILRSFALQNAGGRDETNRRWRRNGRLCVEHGGIFPMGFYACRDGHVALLGRSRRDWRMIREAVGDPDWAKTPAFDDPFVLARDSAEADLLLERTLLRFDRDTLLARGLETGAVIAPVYSQQEAEQRKIFRPGFIEGGQPVMPFVAETVTRSVENPARSSTPAQIDTPATPLNGLRCIELCWVWSGPMTTQILADLGAEVIKVETPERFDLYRTRGLEHLRGKMHERTRIESSLYFHSLNRNKLGLSLDLKTPAGRSAMLQLVGQSDIVVENFTVGTLERLGFDNEALEKSSPDIVRLSMSGPGRGSAVEGLRSYGLVLSALGGAEATVVDKTGFLGSPTFSISDPNAAVFGAMAALAGTLRVRGGLPGSFIDLSQIEAAATLAGTTAPPRDTRDAILEAADGVCVAVSVPRQCHADNAGMHAAFAGLDRHALSERCAALGGQAVELIDLLDTEKAPVFTGNTGWVAACHPYGGDEMVVAAPWLINGMRPPVRKPAPLMAESNDYVLRGILRLDDATLVDLNADTPETLS